jgi:uncharacterized membrane protein YczE
VALDASAETPASTRPRQAVPWRRVVRVAIVAVPPLILAAAGVTHPMQLTPQTAAYWRDMHIWLLGVFPLLALSPWLLLRPESAPLRWAAALLGYVYAAGYTGLDVLAGIGAGAVEERTGDHDSTDALFHYAGDLATVGVYAFLAATALAVVVLVRRAGLAAGPGGVLVVGAAYSFIDSHILWPRGVVTMLALAVGWTALLWAADRRPAPDAGQHRTDGM